MKKYYAFLSIVFVSIFSISIVGCDQDDSMELIQDTPVAFVSVSPEEGSTTSTDSTLTLLFDGIPENITVSNGTATTENTKVDINGPFTLGELSIDITWEGGTTTLNYTVEYPLTKVVDIPDPELRLLIENRLQIERDTPIKVGDMLKLTELDGYSYMSSLIGLEYAKNLTILYLEKYWDDDRNGISDISPLKNLTNLEELDLSGNTISDISPLENLTKLKELRLYDINISDISPLKNLANLGDLRLGWNDISDISPLENLITLKYLILDENTISDINPLKDLTNLVSLDLNGNDISDISALKNLTNLEGLYLGSNDISDISPLKNLTFLGELSLKNNNITDISPLTDLAALKYLGLKDKPLNVVSKEQIIPLIEQNGTVVIY